MYIGDWLGRREWLTPERLALVDATTNTRYTYGELNARANRMAAVLRDHFQVRKGERVAILAHNSVLYLDLLFATAKLGVILVPLNWRLTPSELIYQLNDSSARLLFYDQHVARNVPHLYHMTTVEHVVPLKRMPDTTIDLEALLAKAPATAVTSEVDLEDPHLILYTSGTTGKPKGAVIPHRVLAWNSLNTNISWELRADDVSIIHTPLFHTGGINVVTLPILHAGGTMVLMGDWDPVRCLELIEQERITVFFAVPTMFQMLLQAPCFASTDLSSVRFFISGGAPCSPALIEAYQERDIPFRQGYGLTEVSVNCFSLSPRDAIRKAGSVGRPVFHLDAQIVDDQGTPVQAGEIGELVLRGPTVCSGYWNNPEATAEVLRDGWFHTGDLAYYDEEGYFFIVDRKKDMFISGGENVYPAEIENILYNHPAVAECAVIGISDSKWGEVGRAFIVLKPGASSSANDLLEHCRRHLARYKVPKSLIFVAELPHNASGKVVKPDLRRSHGEPVQIMS